LSVLACDEDISTPSFSRQRLSKWDFKSLSSNAAGTGEVFFEELPAKVNDDQKSFLFITRYYQEMLVPLAARGYA
jgi:hypothetical protein